MKLASSLFPHLNVSLPMGFWPFSTRYGNLGLFDPILEWRLNEGLEMGHNITIYKNGLENELLTSKKTVIEFHLFITVGI